MTAQTAPRPTSALHFTALLALCMLVPALAGCANSHTVRAEIVTAGYPEYFLASRIAGTTHSSVLLGKPGTSVHDFDPDAQDIDTMQHAKAILLHGMSLEQWGDKAQAAVGTSGPQFITTAPSAASLGLDQYFTPPPNGDAGLTVDPHTWTDPYAYAQEAKVVEDALANLFPQDAATLHSNAANLVSDLMGLHASFKAGLHSCQRHEIVTNHDAYFYLAHEYNFSTYALHGLTPDGEPTQQQVQDAIDAINRDHLPVIFLEDGTSPGAVQSIVDQTHVKVDILSPNEVKPASGDYITVQQSNLVKLQSALGCTGA